MEVHTLRTLGDVMEEAQEERTRRLTEGFQYGVWKYHPSDKTIESTRTGYYVRALEFKDASSILDWIAQVSAKQQYSDEEIGQLVRAINMLIHLQSQVCSGGFNHTVDPEELLTP